MLTTKERSIPFADFHRLPGDTPEKDTNLNHGELITAIELPKNNFAGKSCCLKIRDRASYAFALISATQIYAESSSEMMKENFKKAFSGWNSTQ